MQVDQPQTDLDYSDRHLNCKQALEPLLIALIEAAQSAGWKRPEAFDALDELLVNFRLAYLQDPDPADDAI